MRAVRSAIPAAEAWYQDATGGNGSYADLSTTNLAKEEPSVSSNVQAFALNGGQGYCLEDTSEGGYPFYYLGGDPGPELPASTAIAAGNCP